MAATPSTMKPLGTQAPDFNLLNPASGKYETLDELKSDKVTVIMFICNHCPYVKHINGKLVEVSDKYMNLGVSFIGISPNDIENYPEDSPDNMVSTARLEGYKFPYLYDDTQDTARDYDAACTPDFFVYDGNMKLAYRGQFDDSRPGNGRPVTGNDLSDAIDALLLGHPVPEIQIPSIGCNIKWKRK